MARGFSILPPMRAIQTTPYTSTQFSKARLTDFGDLPRGDIPLPLEVSPKSNLYTLKNGAKVFCEEYPSNFTVVSLFLKAGSRYETENTSGAAHLLVKTALSGTKSKGREEVLKELNSFGGSITYSLDRELVGFHVKALKGNAGKAAEFLCKHVLGAKEHESIVEIERQALVHGINDVSKDQHRQNTEFLFYTSFRDHQMGQPLLGNKDTVQNLTLADLQLHIDRTFSGPNALLIATGDISSENDVKSIAEQYLGALPDKTKAETPNLDKPLFTSSFYVARDDELINVNGSVGYIGPGLDHPETFKYKMFQEILGDYNARDMGMAQLNNGSMSYNILQQQIGSMPGFGLGITSHYTYSDVSLFTSYLHGNDVHHKLYYTLIPFTLARAATYLNAVELFRARASIFNKLLARNASTKTNEGIAREVMYAGRRIDRTESARRFSALLCENEMRRFAFEKFLEANVGVALWGNVHHMMTEAYYGFQIRNAVRGHFWVQY